MPLLIYSLCQECLSLFVCLFKILLVQQSAAQILFSLCIYFYYVISFLLFYNGLLM